MNKLILEFFKKLKMFVEFLKIVVVFTIMLFFLFWAETLIGTSWSFLNFIRPTFVNLVGYGEGINNGSMMLFAAVFKYSYMIAFIILLCFYGIFHLCYKAVCVLQNLYEEGHKQVKKLSEATLNNELSITQVSEQKKMQRYAIYIAILPKVTRQFHVKTLDLNEQAKEMNKFLIDKTGVMPEKFEDGFYYEFERFDTIDSSLDAFCHVLNSEAPVDYRVCCILYEKDKYTAKVALKKLIELNLLNKIAMFSNTAYRYGFIEKPRYETIQIGLYQKEGDTFEIHEFVKKV